VRFFVRPFPDTDSISRQHVVYLKSKCALIGSDAPPRYLDPTILYPIESMLHGGVGTAGLGNYYRKYGNDSLRFPFYFVISGFDGEHTESNHRLM
jgi:hypothetical protein